MTLETFFTDKSGIEIGGPSPIFQNGNIIPVYQWIKNLDGVNFSDNTIWEGGIKEGLTYAYEPGRPIGRQYIMDAVHLPLIDDETYECVISSHCIEHIANPIRALKEWLRILVDEGFLLLVVPHKDGTFDHRRPVTTVQHLIENYQKEIGEDDLSHLDEILALHDLSMDKPAGNLMAFRERSLGNYSNRCLHHHVFNTRLVLQLIDYMKLKIVTLALSKPMHIIVLAKKTPKSLVPDNTDFITPNAWWIKKSPFVSDR